MDKKEAEQLAGEIAEEISELIANRIKRLEKRIENLEGSLKNHISNFKIVAVETERMITEKYRELEGNIEKLSEDITSLDDAIKRLSKKIK